MAKIEKTNNPTTPTYHVITDELGTTDQPDIIDSIRRIDPRLNGTSIVTMKSGSGGWKITVPVRDPSLSKRKDLLELVLHFLVSCETIPTKSVTKLLASVTE